MDLFEDPAILDFDSQSFIEHDFPDWEPNQVDGTILANDDFRPTIPYDQAFAEPRHPLPSLPRSSAPLRSVPDPSLLPDFQVYQPVPEIAIQDAYALIENGSGAASTQIHSSFSGTGVQSPLYQNSILNQFGNPAVPLRIIDDFFHPFPKALVTALTRELTPQSQVVLDYLTQALEPLSDRQQQEERRSQSEQARAPVGDISTPMEYLDLASSQNRLAVPQQTPRSRQSGTSSPALRVAKNKRQQNIKGFDATKFYKPPLAAPTSWTARPPGRRPTTFDYTINGELTPERRFTDQEITDYLQYHPGHENNTATSKLRLWIQSTPADSRMRYATTESAKCRFESCPTKKGTIRTGEFRVCFDEQSWTNNPKLDPFHNAGYVHLYCLEKNFNFHDLYHEFNVQPDDRKWQNEPSNRMAITRDRQSMLEVCEEYKNRDRETMKVKAWNDEENAWFTSSLTYALTKHHIENVAEHTRKIMETRGGCNISDHLGDLQKLAIYKEKSYENGKKRKRSSPGVAEEMETEEGATGEDDVDEILHVEEPRRKRARS